jgi:hypothetical protein
MDIDERRLLAHTHVVISPFFSITQRAQISRIIRNNQMYKTHYTLNPCLASSDTPRFVHNFKLSDFVHYCRSPTYLSNRQLKNQYECI